MSSWFFAARRHMIEKTAFRCGYLLEVRVEFVDRLKQISHFPDDEEKEVSCK
jgi:hypothetical protein